MSGGEEVLRVPGSGRDTQDSEPAVNLRYWAAPAVVWALLGQAVPEPSDLAGQWVLEFSVLARRWVAATPAGQWQTAMVSARSYWLDSGQVVLSRLVSLTHWTKSPLVKHLAPPWMLAMGPPMTKMTAARWDHSLLLGSPKESHWLRS